MLLSRPHWPTDSICTEFKAAHSRHSVHCIDVRRNRNEYRTGWVHQKIEFRLGRRLPSCGGEEEEEEEEEEDEEEEGGGGGGGTGGKSGYILRGPTPLAGTVRQAGGGRGPEKSGRGLVWQRFGNRFVWPRPLSYHRSLTAAAIAAALTVTDLRLRARRHARSPIIRTPL
ncbi:hypothetical protein ElyMa_004427900 [Elysia marginata]|uniref:Uncharacterized protein n=1 Tax=Elysia marginata TaxID=1093978 RepID=A0AAV4HD68_9GAST|nr:hypothetical protein ElyMa_004427900 [Elysia marginata]